MIRYYKKTLSILALLLLAYLFFIKNRLPYPCLSAGHPLEGSHAESAIFPLVGTSLSAIVCRDIIFMTEMLVENHPGQYNSQDQGFAHKLKMAHQESLDKAKNITTSDEHIKLLKNYVQYFNDSHLRVFCSSECSSTQPSISKPGQDFTLTALAHRVVWISIPTFTNLNSKQQEQINAIITQLPTYRADGTIIFDLRGNIGGCSLWGKRIAQSLFGDGYIEQVMQNLEISQQINWRASKDNVNHMYSLIDYLKGQFGPDSEVLQEMQSACKGMEAALHLQQPLYCQACTTNQKLDADVHQQNQCAAKIIAIIDSSNVSAALDFLDILTSLNKPTLLVGSTTSAASVYNEVRLVQLPSNCRQLQFPIKAFHNRKRGHNQPYHPDVAYTGNLSDTKRLQEWVLSEIIKP